MFGALFFILQHVLLNPPIVRVIHSPGMGTGATYSFTFANPGTFDYMCSIHPFMHGTVVVTK